MTNWHTYDEAAAKLRIKRRFLERNISQLPHSKFGRETRFSDEHLEQIGRLFERRPTTGPLAETVPAPSGAHPLAHLKPRPARGSLRVSS